MRKINRYSNTHRTTVCDNHSRTNKMSNVYASTTIYVANHKDKKQVAYPNIHFAEKYAAKIVTESIAKGGKKPFFIDEIYDSNGIVYYRSLRYSDALLLVTPCV